MSLLKPASLPPTPIVTTRGVCTPEVNALSWDGSFHWPRSRFPVVAPEHAGVAKRSEPVGPPVSADAIRCGYARGDLWQRFVFWMSVPASYGLSDLDPPSPAANESPRPTYRSAAVWFAVSENHVGFAVLEFCNVS